MITVCTVAPEGYEGWLETLLASVLEHSQHVTQVLIAQTVPSTDTSIIEEYEKKGIHFKKFYAPINFGEHGHSLGLHACIDRVETEYILFCDPDVFWYTAVDDLYLKLMEKYNLHYVGCSHHSAVANAYSYFPYVMNSLVRKKDLPDENFLKGQLKFRNGCIMVEQLNADDSVYELADGKYLVSSPIPGLWHKFPNVKPDVFFDTSINLCYWGMEQNWRWIAFQTYDAHDYTTKYFRGSVKIKDRIPPQKIIYHDVRRDPALMKKMHNKSKEEEKND